ncbi:MAG: hypothetical protein ACK5MP_12140 [Nostocoides sp.]
MQNSLERIFEGLQYTLREVIAPSVSDPYIHSQITSVAEIVANLSTRVEWDCTQARELIEHIGGVLERAETAVPGGNALVAQVLAEGPPPPGAGNAELLQARDRHLSALRQVQQTMESSPDSDVDDAIRAFLAWQVETETARLRSGIFSAAK